MYVMTDTDQVHGRCPGRRSGPSANRSPTPKGRQVAAVVGAPRGVVADLADRGDVEDVVQPSVAGAGEPVADLGAGGGVEGDGAGPGGEPVAVGEPGHVADVGQDPGGTARADAVRSMRPDPVAATVCRNRRASCFSLSSRACTSATSSTASSRRIRRAGPVAAPTRASSWPAWRSGAGRRTAPASGPVSLAPPGRRPVSRGAVGLFRRGGIHRMAARTGRGVSGLGSGVPLRLSGRG
jgi:hypothetical protein